MNILPPAGPQRSRQLTLLGLLLVVLSIVVWRYVLPESSAGAPVVNGPAVNRPVTSNPQARPGQPANAAAPSGLLPEALKLGSLEPVPDAPEVTRNPFAFGARPAPPKPVDPAPQIAQAPPPPPKPPWPPPIQLKLVVIMDGPDGRRQAGLKDPATGAIYTAVEGMVVDGRYKIVKIAGQSVVISYLDGSGQRTLILGG